MFGKNPIPPDLDAKLGKPVKLNVFTSLTNEGYRQCPVCENTMDVVKDLHHASSKVEFEEISLVEDKTRAEHYAVSRAPTIIIQGHGIRYTGAPLGLELAPFVYTIIMASTGQSILGDFMAREIEHIRKAKLELIVTPTCPYCAQAVLIVNSLVLESAGKLVVDIVESYENPDIARKYNVSGVPVTVIDGDQATQIVGVPTLATLLSRLR